MPETSPAAANCSLAAAQEKYESYADLFAIIKTVEKLEKARAPCCAGLLPGSSLSAAQAYVRDAVKPEEYETACLDLLAKFKTLRAALRDDGVPDVEHFMATYKMDCASAAARLLRSGMPATIEHGKPRCAAQRGCAGAAAQRPLRAPPGAEAATRQPLWRRRRSTTSPAWTC